MYKHILNQNYPFCNISLVYCFHLRYFIKPNSFCTDARLQFITFMLIFILLTWIISSFVLCTKWKEEIISTFHCQAFDLLKHPNTSILTRLLNIWSTVVIFSVTVTYSCRDLGQAAHSYSRGREVIRYMI